MIIEVIKAKKVDELNGFSGVVVSAEVLTKDFDDSAYQLQFSQELENYRSGSLETPPVYNESSASFKITQKVILDEPASGSFVSLEGITKEIVKGWIESDSAKVAKLTQKHQYIKNLKEASTPSKVTSDVEF